MQIIIDTAVDTLADINLATYCLEVLKARHGQPREEKQMELPIEPVKDLWSGMFGIDKGASSHADVASLVSPQPVVDQVGTTGSVRSGQSGTDNAQDSSVPDPVPAPPASDVAHLPAHLRNRLPEVPSLAVDEDTDAAGVKWDATLHSESRSKTADGTWRKRRTAKNVVVSAPVSVSASDAIPVVPMPSAPEPDYTVPDVPIPPTTPVATPFVPVTTFRELMEQMTIHMASRKVTSKDINAICHEHGIESLQMCFDNTALIPSVHTAIHKIAMKAGV